MDRVVGHARRWHVLARVRRRPTVRLILHDLDVVAVGIFHHEVLVAGPALAHALGHRDAPRCQVVAHPIDALGHHDTLRRQIVAHAIGIVGIDGDVIELALAGRGTVEELNPLAVVDLDESNLDRAVRLRQREGLLEPQEVPVERSGLGEVADEDGEVRHAEDLRTRDRRLGGRRCGKDERKGKENCEQRLHAL